ncbi:PLP-dependent lyase/thiolase [Couchioplanes caeruleus]|uniref:Tryptophan synthase beta chain-like PALP domain-containing protein n=2 Tax=Couchioplanes caeruleus TaxID=56438 RepID=A0A1K0GU18_9ACTN|nr:PLP-dependent lyase/thiolase [Couchioplanes caeruleus]OJF14796.1 hypothetical protein BG844_07945 [Couchioplanes caeruleus subsp. caeruleus]ROP27540.1 threonine dehydratase [Couchioplanes caeruleus]
MLDGSVHVAKNDHTMSIRQAGDRLVRDVVRTPVHLVGADVWLKREDLQRGSSFKMRGAANVVRTARIGPQSPGVVCASSGNTGLALAMLTRELAVPAYVFVPARATGGKVEALRRLGARVVHVPGDFSGVARAARTFASRHDLLYCSSATTWDFIYGNATVGVELLEQCASLDEVFVPIGGGGLAAGVGLALSVLPWCSRPRLVGVELETSCPVREFLRSSPAVWSPCVSVADCLDGDLESGAIVLQLAEDVLDDIVLVSDADLLRAQWELARSGILVEPGPAAAFAGYRAVAGRRPAGRTAVLVTGSR